MESYKKDNDAELAAKPAEYDPKKKTWHKEQMNVNHCRQERKNLFSIFM